MATSRRRRRSDNDVMEDATNEIVEIVVAAERYSGEKPVFENVQPDSLTPYSDATKTRGQKEPMRVKRPLNTFMVFAHYMRSKLQLNNDRLNNAIVSKRLGEIWKTYSAAEKQPFADEANRLKLLHAKQYPNYRYRPRRRINDDESETQRRASLNSYRSIKCKRASRNRRKRASWCSSPRMSDSDPASIDSSCISPENRRLPKTNKRRYVQPSITCHSACLTSESVSDSGRGTLLNDSYLPSVSTDQFDNDERDRNCLCSQNAHCFPSHACHSGVCHAHDSERLRPIQGTRRLLSHGLLPAAVYTGCAWPHAMFTNPNVSTSCGDRCALSHCTMNSRPRLDAHSQSQLHLTEAAVDNGANHDPLSVDGSLEREHASQGDAESSSQQVSIALATGSFTNYVVPPHAGLVGGAEPHVLVPASMLTGMSYPFVHMTSGCEPSSRLFMLVPTNQHPFAFGGTTGLNSAALVADSCVASNRNNHGSQLSPHNPSGAFDEPASAAQQDSVLAARAQTPSERHISATGCQMETCGTSPIPLTDLNNNGQCVTSEYYVFEDYAQQLCNPSFGKTHLTESKAKNTLQMNQVDATGPLNNAKRIAEDTTPSVTHNLETLLMRQQCDTPPLHNFDC